MQKQNKKLLVTHNGSFHADDVFACATLILLLEKKGETFEIKRTRDEEIIKGGDYVFDVGGVYDPSKNFFDHHQIGGAGKRDNGIEYSSFGLVWQKYGEEVCGGKETAFYIEKDLVMPVDAGDNGMDLTEQQHEVTHYYIQDFFRSFKPSWKNVNEETLLSGFQDAVKIAKDLLSREILLAKDFFEAENKMKECYEKSEDKRIVIFDQKYPWEVEMSKYSEPLFVIFPRQGGLWGAEGVFLELPSFKKRKNFPSEWGGLRDEELQKITGVSDAVFCHRGLFMVVAKSQEGVKKLVELTLKK